MLLESQHRVAEPQARSRVKGMYDDRWLVGPSLEVGFSSICNQAVSFDAATARVEFDQDYLAGKLVIGKPYFVAR